MVLPRFNNDWSGQAAQAPPADWSHLATDPLSAGSSSWAASTQPSVFYDPVKSGGMGDYDPSFGRYTMYDPTSAFTTRTIQAGIEGWMRSEYPHLFEFDTGAVNTGFGAQPGDVSRGTQYGQFHQDPRVYDEIQAAANKWKVPANLIKAMIQRESEGMWSGANTGSVWLGDRGHRIVGYSGITEPAAAAWGYDFNQLIGNRALQIDAVGKGLSLLYQNYGEQYGWDGVIAAYYSGDPTAATTPSDSYQYGTTQEYLRDVKMIWGHEDDWVQKNGGTVWSQGATGLSSPQKAEWAPINRWDNYVANAASKYGIPANLIKAVMRLESNGDPNAGSPAGATGLMQVMPGIHGASRQQLLDPAFNIDKGASILRNNFNRYGSWELATKAYLAGDPYSTAVDAHGTGVALYWNKISGYWDMLNAGVSGVYGGDPAESAGPVMALEAIWGNVPYSISQEHGPSAFANSRPGWYEYSYNLLGALGHPGIDVAIPAGTPLYSPVGGTVEIAGPEHGYRIGAEMDVYTPQTGQLMIRLDNGHQLILGHMNGIYVTPGNRVNPGQLVGVSGMAGTGDHVHVEYRVPSSNPGGWAAVDPREALMGVYTGGFSTPTDRAGVTRPMTYDEILRAAATGQPVDYGSPMSSGNSWNTWLQQVMTGNVPASSSTGSMALWGAAQESPFAYAQAPRQNVSYDPTR